MPIILFGWDNIQKDILHTNLTQTQANKLEKYYIKKYDSCKKGYNENEGNTNTPTEIQYIWIHFSWTLHELLQSVIPIAAQQLKECGFKLLLYLLKYNNQTIPFYSSNIYQDCGISRNSVKNGFNELTEKHFLVQTQPQRWELNSQLFLNI